MQCNCDNIPSLPSSEGTIFFFIDVIELLEKTRLVLENLGIAHFSEQDTIKVAEKNCYTFLKNLMESGRLDTVEEEAIRIVIADPDETLTFSMVARSMKLAKAFNIIRESDFYTIMQSGALTVHSQPIIDMANQNIFAYETLLRGVREDGSLMYPDHLFEQAKKDDLTFVLDKMARESAIRYAAEHKIEQKLFINFIPTAIYDPEHCLRTTEEWASKLDIKPEQIVFEVVESEQVEDIKHLQKILDYYRKKGYQTALDDVGSGYSSLNMFVQLETDYIKVDREIIADIHTNTRKQAVYRGLYETAKEHGVTVLAEGVETADELSYIQSIGVDLVQGYYYAKPSAQPVQLSDLLSDS